ncbi:MAG: hypothetical protein JKY67_15350 [Pseudomonadales bacterium]|nr:hypothetical protein [Pseudomonadales bacterium]
MLDLITMIESIEKEADSKESEVTCSAEETTTESDAPSADEELQFRLLREIARLEWLLGQVAKGPMGTRQILANAYQDMIEQRRELLKRLST